MCESNYEEIIHVLLECPNVVLVWSDVNLWDKIGSIILRENYNIDVVVFTLLHQLGSSQSELFATFLWSLWKRRNLKLWWQKNETNMQVVERASHLLGRLEISSNYSRWSRSAC
uniref:Probable reverse transcriptase At2g02650-, related n=1 Tax=Medicago truncatula TaxID=3880 RepID=A2Q4Z2_MEDTR|nr:probable reverse transcriptase At2g02650 -, related [Medicago truncatula]